VYTILTPEAFDIWLASLRDRDARQRIAARLRRIGLGNLGDAKPAGGPVSELRIDYGPGYRLYFTRRGLEVIVLLIGGDKSSQSKDIKRAMKMVAQLPE